MILHQVYSYALAPGLFCAALWSCAINLASCETGTGYRGFAYPVGLSAPPSSYNPAAYRPAKELGAPCRFSSDCRESAYICSNNGSCECAPGYKSDPQIETCVGAIGSKCMYDSHCIGRAYCKGQTICTCKLEFPVVSSDKWSCKEFGSKAVAVASSFINLSLLYFLQFLLSDVLSLNTT